MLPKEGKIMAAAKVVQRSLGTDGKVIGSFSHNKMLDTMIYDIMYMDGTAQQLATNRVALSIIVKSD